MPGNCRRSWTAENDRNPHQIARSRGLPVFQHGSQRVAALRRGGRDRHDGTRTWPGGTSRPRIRQVGSEKSAWESCPTAPIIDLLIHLISLTHMASERGAVSIGQSRDARPCVFPGTATVHHFRHSLCVQVWRAGGCLLPLELSASAHAGRFSLSRSSRELQALPACCWQL
jgi:hypothetical protein